jgi:predicted O-methyltransferase YrrM
MPIGGSFFRRLPFVRRLEVENQRLRDALQQWRLFSPPGHFESPLPSQEEVASAFRKAVTAKPAGIDLNEADQLQLLDLFAHYYKEQPFPNEKTADRRYYLENQSYGAFDGIMLYCMLRRLRPRRVIEIGSGFSSAAMLDIDDLVLGGHTDFTFIDPDMSRLSQVLRPEDVDRVRCMEMRVQDVIPDIFLKLEANDVLFIDSSHVSKVGSDVNYILFELLPLLQSGVRIHIHDVFGTFEYPRQWLDSGRAYNEQYLIRSFLMYNRVFKIELFSSWLFDNHHNFLRDHLPLCATGGGGQLWLHKKVGSST